MKIFYVILTYNHPALLGRTIGALAGPESWFYIHVDKQIGTAPFRQQTAGQPQVRFLDDTERVASKWGHISTVDAALNTLRKIKAEHPDEKEGFIVLLSGQDYPIRSRAYIRDFLESHASTTFMQTEPLPYSNLSEGGLNRVRDTYFHLGGRLVQRIRPYRIDKENAVTYYKILRYRPSQLFAAIGAFFVRRKFPLKDYRHYVGEFWCGFPLQTGDLLLDLTDSHPEYRNFHRRTMIPEECFFHTLVANNVEKLPGPLDGGTLHYVDWSDRHTPAVFDTSHRDALLRVIETEPELLFARKFDDSTPEGREILDFIDSHIHER
ncbi:beta-1,6-N-acetylglucosaminyltransferase [uncultured Rikenella sp.]|uniref:beta-1,6-N-acetylglucosaminyltransferase n=1 Tax=uncultured Rikenella sp. TaxID=368003 RepID=UPI002602C56A|nr:beta-1,6-N-acetylglucosaminyltransferase [uncultured Rikenella sp.]